MPITDSLPSIFINKTDANARIVNYQQNKHGLLSDALSIATSINDREETKCIWYSKAQIEDWVSEMNLIGADGVRLYFGAYGVEEAVSQNGQLTLVAILTEADNSSHKDIIYEDQEWYEGRLGENERNFEPKSKQFNYGSLCPPSCISGDSAFPLAEES